MVSGDDEVLAMRGERFGRRRTSSAVLSLVLIVAALVSAACNTVTRTFPPFPVPSATVDDRDLAAGESPAVVAGPDLGETWTTEPDPDTFLALDDGRLVAPDQYLVMLGRSSTEADAQRVAASVEGTIGGHIAYIGLWKVLVAPVTDVSAWAGRLAALAHQPGVLVAAPVAQETVQSAPDCAPALSDPVYAGDYSKPYDMIGVKAAWQAFYASGLPVADVHVGIVDTELTRDPSGKIPWEFDDVTFANDPQTTPNPEPTLDGFHHADGILGILAGSGQNGGMAGVGSPLGSRLIVSQDAWNGQQSKWTARDGTTYTDEALIKTLRQIESGATIINGSWGALVAAQGNASGTAMWKAFLQQMAEEHPEVLFVFAAGNDDAQLDGNNYYPGGIAGDNVITVGNIANDGGRYLAQFGQNNSSNGIMPDSEAEITLGAPGDQAVWGVGLDGQVQHANGGTSSATAMVTATTALIRSVDPTLTASQIKDMIARSADQGDPEVGGLTLRVDRALREAIDGARAKLKPALNPLTDADIAAATKYCQIDVTATLTERLTDPADSSRWQVQASIEHAPGKTALSLLVDGGKPINWSQTVASASQTASWTLLVSKNGASIVVTRHDNGYWVKRRLIDTGDASPAPSLAPSLAPMPPPNPPEPEPTYDCSNPPQPGTLAYATWSLKCRSFSP
jgi:hypothetical protein